MCAVLLVPDNGIRAALHEILRSARKLVNVTSGAERLSQLLAVPVITGCQVGEIQAWRLSPALYRAALGG
jgi:hypothetical protein